MTSASTRLPADYACRIEADSINPEGHRLTTMVVTYPRCIHAEMLTHRVFSRNSSSSRAVPVEKQIRSVAEQPFIPTVAANQRGMQAGDLLSPNEQYQFSTDVRQLKRQAVEFADRWKHKIHKQWLNRYLEPFGWITTIISSTSWKNFFSLRCHPTAQPEMQIAAGLMRDAYLCSVPQRLLFGQWHLPFIKHEEYASKVHTLEDLQLISTARCARVSYLAHDGKTDAEADVKLALRLIGDRHLSPLEHPATPVEGRCGNYAGWQQLRYLVPRQSGEEQQLC